MHRDELEKYLNELLDIHRFQDYCPNGLQVEGRPEIQSIVSGVTASIDLLQAAIAAKADANSRCIMAISGAMKMSGLLA